MLPEHPDHANGNLSSVVPPGRPAHGFLPTPVDLMALYTPPALAGIANPSTVYAYDLDRRLDLVTRPDGATVDPRYDAAGRLETLVAPHGTTGFGYDDGTPPLIAGTGNLVSITAPGSENLVLGYDGSLPRQTTWSGPVAGSVTLGYDDDLRVSSQTVGGQPSASFLYDDDGLLTHAGAMTLTRHPQHGLVSAAQLGSLTTTLGYNAFGELASESTAGLYSASYPVRVQGHDLFRTKRTATFPHLRLQRVAALAAAR